MEEFAGFHFEGRSLRATGTYQMDSEPMRLRVLTFDLLLLGLGGSTFKGGSLSAIPRFPKVRFELRPDLPYSLIGSKRWEIYSQSAGQPVRIGSIGPLVSSRVPPSYRFLYNQLLRDTPIVAIEGIPLRRLSVALRSEHFDWRGKPPVFGIGISEQLEPGICCLGRDFLQYGILAWKTGVSYFYPAGADQEVYSGFPPGRFRAPVTMPIKRGRES